MELVHADASEVWLVIEDPVSKGFVSLPQSKESYYLVCLFLKPWRYLNKRERYLGSFERLE